MKEKSIKEKLIKNFNWLLLDRVIRLVGGLFIGVWVARYLGPERYGVLNYAVAFVALVGVVAQLGMDQLVVRELATRPNQQPAILGTVLSLKFVTGLIAIFLIIPAAWFIQRGDSLFTLLVAIIALGLVFNTFDAYDLFYQAEVMSRYVVISYCASFVIFSAVRVVFILGTYSVTYFAIAVTMEIAVGRLFLFISYRRYDGRIAKWYFDRRVMIGLLKDGWPLIASSALIAIHTRIDQVMLGHILGNTEVGIYSAAVRLSTSWLFLPSIIVQTVTPYLLTLRDINTDFYHARLMQLYSIMFWLGTAAAVLTVLFGKPLIVLLFGKAYQDAYLPLVLTIWTGIFISQSVARGIWMVGENLQAYRFINNVIAVPVNIILNLVLIPSYGVAGAAMASLLSIGGGTWIVPFFFKPMRFSNQQLIFSINPKYLFVGQ